MPITQVITYYLLLILVNLATSTWASYFISRDIRTGNLTPYLLKPKTFVNFQIGNNIGEKIVKLGYIIPLFYLLIIFTHTKIPHLDLWHTSALLISVGLAATISFFIDICIGLATFWLETTEAIDDLYGMVSTFLSGKMVPLAVLPEFVNSLNNYLPFRYTLSFPLEIWLNQIDNQDIVRGILIQTLWLAIVCVIYRIMWQKGIRKYSAIGA